MILYGNTKKKQLIVDTTVEILVDCSKSLITFSKSALDGLGLANKYVGLAEDDKYKAENRDRKIFLYEAQDKQGFKLFGNGNLTSNYYALLLKDTFSRGSVESFKLTIDLTPIEDADAPGMKFYEIKKITKESVETPVQSVSTTTDTITEVPLETPVEENVWESPILE